jgi:spermidine synthase
MLNSSNANYSFGNLHLIFQMAFKDSKLSFRSDANVLLLGMGGGSVVDILRREYDFQGRITAIEIDPLVITLYKTYFEKANSNPIELICEDAKLAIENLPEKSFTLLVCDLFVDLEVPLFVWSETFIRSMNRILSADGILYLNVILPKGDNLVSTNQLMEIFFKYFNDVVRLNYHERNLFIVARKTK